MTQTRPPSAQRKYLETVYPIFQHFALADQRTYYEQAVRKYRKSGEQVNRLRALFALSAGLASALIALIVGVYLAPGALANGGVCAGLPQAGAFIQAGPETMLGPETVRPAYCRMLEIGIAVLTVTAIVAPAIGAALTTLSDLYQWDRLASIYESALENIEVADSQSPLPEMDEIEYKASLRAYAEAALSVMRDETAQWGQVAQPPQQVEQFIAEERLKAAEVNGSADDLVPGRRVEPPADPGTLTP